MENNKLANPQSFQDALKDKIKSTMVDLIPEADWDELIRNAMETFITGTPEKAVRGQFGGTTTVPAQPSELQKLTNKIVSKHLEEKITEILNTKFKNWDGYDFEAKMATVIENFIKENASTIFTSMLGGMIQNAVNNLHAPSNSY